jgi:hypothetical protein
MSTRNIQTLFFAIVLLTACNSNRRQPLIQEGPKTGQNPGTDTTISGDKEQKLPSDDSSNNPSLPIVLDEAALKKAYASIDTSKMSYSFEYLATKSVGTVKFENGKAHLEFKDLKAGEKGDLSFTLLESNVPKLRGEQKDVVLSKGKNQITLVLKSVGSQDGNATELTINVEVNPSDVAPIKPDPTPTPKPDPTSTPKPDPTSTPKPDTGGGLPIDPNALSFASAIKPIMMKHCAECHHQGGHTPDLTSKGAFETQFDKILGRIEGAGQPMPPLPRDRMKSEEIQTLRSWKSQGLKP